MYTKQYGYILHGNLVPVIEHFFACSINVEEGLVKLVTCSDVLTCTVFARSDATLD